MTNYSTVNCVESCPKCKHKIRFEIRHPEDMGTPHARYNLDCDYVKDFIVNPRTECNGMFEPREVEE